MLGFAISEGDIAQSVVPIVVILAGVGNSEGKILCKRLIIQLISTEGKQLPDSLRGDEQIHGKRVGNLGQSVIEDGVIGRLQPIVGSADIKDIQVSPVFLICQILLWGGGTPLGGTHPGDRLVKGVNELCTYLERNSIAVIKIESLLVGHLHNALRQSKIQIRVGGKGLTFGSLPEGEYQFPIRNDSSYLLHISIGIGGSFQDWRAFQAPVVS